MAEKVNLKIIQIISKTIRIDPNVINKKSGMKDFAKWDSLAHLQIMMEIEKQFNKKISTSKMSDLNTVRKILEFLKS
jgi:acyl carrier protein